MENSSSFHSLLSLVCIICLQSISLTNSDFSAYSSQLKKRLGISQVQLNNLTTASHAGKLFGFFSGMAANHLPLWSLLVIGGIIGLIGYGIQFLFLANKIASLSYWHVIILSVLAGNAICWTNTVCYVVLMRKFSPNYGVIIGLATSYSGLSAKMYLAISELIYGNNPDDKSIYLLLNGIVPLGVGIVVAPFFRDMKPAGTGNGACLAAMFVIAGATGLYAMVQATFPVEFGNVPPRVVSMVLLIMVVSIFVVPLVKVGELTKERCRRSSEVVAIRGVESGGGVGYGGERMEEEGRRNVEDVIREGREIGVREMVMRLEFWLYFVVYACGGSLGLVYVNNLGQIAQSRGASEAALLSVASSFIFFGKLFTAPLLALARSKHMVSTSALMVMLMAPMAASFFLMLNSTKASLLIGTAIIGMCSGAMVSIAAPMTSELFGSKHFNVNFNIIIMNIPISSLLFGYIAALIYDREGGGEQGPCLGVKCYYKTFVIWGSICSLGTLLSSFLHCRMRK